MPLEGLNVEVGEPLKRVEKKEEEMRDVAKLLFVPFFEASFDDF